MVQARTRSILLVAALALPLAAACQTAPLVNPEPIAVPPGLSSQQVEVAILSGIRNTPPPPDYRLDEDMDEAEFDAFVRRHLMSDLRRRSWFAESREPGVVHAAVDTRGHYLRVAVRFDTDQVRIQLAESRNLKQSRNRIHGRALRWMRNLEFHVRRELNRMYATAGG